jgi:hypothetical protein
VNIDHIEANDNRLKGATITAVGNVSISNSNFNNNKGTTLDSSGTPTFHGYGLEVVTSCNSAPGCTPGSIFLNFVEALNNNLFGARLASGADVFVSNSNFSDQTSGSTTDQTGRGLEVVGGNVLLDTVTLNNNQTFGANIQATGIISLASITATNNGTNGVEIQANCSNVSLINGSYSNNGQFGLSVTNGTVSQGGTVTFGGNGVGDIFQDPGTCVFPVSGPATTPSTPQTSPQGGNVLSSVTSNTLSSSHAFNTGLNFKSSSNISGNLAKVTLSSFLANTSLSTDSHIGLFMGRYAYIYSLYGMQIVVFLPSSLNSVAMVGPH